MKEKPSNAIDGDLEYIRNILISDASNISLPAALIGKNLSEKYKTELHSKKDNIVYFEKKRYLIATAACIALACTVIWQSGILDNVLKEESMNDAVASPAEYAQTDMRFASPQFAGEESEEGLMLHEDANMNSVTAFSDSQKEGAAGIVNYINPYNILENKEEYISTHIIISENNNINEMEYEESQALDLIIQLFSNSSQTNQTLNFDSGDIISFEVKFSNGSLSFVAADNPLKIQYIDSDGTVQYATVNDESFDSVKKYFSPLKIK